METARRKVQREPSQSFDGMGGARVCVLPGLTPIPDVIDTR
jgi:hypothetical protein